VLEYALRSAASTPHPMRCRMGLSALGIAAREGHLEAVRTLLAAGADINRADKVSARVWAPSAPLRCLYFEGFPTRHLAAGSGECLCAALPPLGTPRASACRLVPRPVRAAPLCPLPSPAGWLHPSARGGCQGARPCRGRPPRRPARGGQRKGQGERGARGGAGERGVGGAGGLSSPRGAEGPTGHLRAPPPFGPPHRALDCSAWACRGAP